MCGCMRAQRDSGETVVCSLFPFGRIIAKTDVVLVLLAQHIAECHAEGPSLTADTLTKHVRWCACRQG